MLSPVVRCMVLLAPLFMHAHAPAAAQLAADESTQRIGRERLLDPSTRLVDRLSDRQPFDTSDQAGRPFRQPIDDLRAVREYLLNASPDSRGTLRFVSLSTWHNSPRYDHRDLHVLSAALLKLFNSLSWEPTMVLLEPVPATDSTVLALDLRDLKWSAGRQWLSIIDRYPYGLKYDYVNDAELRQVSMDVQELSNSELPLVRADWFVFAASQPPLYHDLLGLPKDLASLEAQLGVNRFDNIEAGNALRAGIDRSAVSQQNRLIERHPSRYGAYWISYDFAPRRGRGDLVRYPLGPKFENNRFGRFAFNHDGHQVIFTLPNGLHGYMLTDANGLRLEDAASADVVYDPLATTGSPGLTNGLTCFRCHQQGITSAVQDEVRTTQAFAGDALTQIKKLYVPSEQFRFAVDQDQRQYATALRAMIESDLLHEPNTSSVPDSILEPISLVAKYYRQELSLTDISAELGLAAVDELADQIGRDQDLQRLGLAKLLILPQGGSSAASITRNRWEAIDGTSLYQDVAVELKLGTPYLPGTTTHLNSRTSHNPLTNP